MLQDWQIKTKLTKFKAVCECAQCQELFTCGFYDARRSSIGHLCKTCTGRITSLIEFTQGDLLEVFDYNPDTGELAHKLDTASGMKGAVASAMHHEGYLSVSIGRKEYLVHRVIWFMVKGYWPEQVVHIDHDRTNNRWVNLREVVSRANQCNTSLSCNNASGVNGVRILPSGRFCAFIMVNRKQISLGTRDTLEEAAALRRAADKQYEFHDNHGI